MRTSDVMPPRKKRKQAPETGRRVPPLRDPENGALGEEPERWQRICSQTPEAAWEREPRMLWPEDVWESWDWEDR